MRPLYPLGLKRQSRISRAEMWRGCAELAQNVKCSGEATTGVRRGMPGSSAASSGVRCTMKTTPPEPRREATRSRRTNVGSVDTATPMANAANVTATPLPKDEGTNAFPPSSGTRTCDRGGTFTAKNVAMDTQIVTRKATRIRVIRMRIAARSVRVEAERLAHPSPCASRPTSFGQPPYLPTHAITPRAVREVAAPPRTGRQ